MASTEDLQSLITEPREDLDAEYKDWLDLTSNEHHKAKLAKTAIALANHGGGYIVIGFEDKGLISRPRPEKIPAITQDSVNAAIRRYAEPEFHCKMYKVPHSDTNVSHPVVSIPSMSTPVMSRRDCQGEVAQNRYYIRKPGPRSEEIKTAEEWRTLLNRCMQEANRATTESVEAQNSMPNALDDLRDYSASAHGRWEELVSDEPDNSPARFPHGYYEMAFSLVGAAPTNDLSELKNRLSEAGRINWSGWPPFSVSPQAPEPGEDFVEAWFGQLYNNNDWISRGPHYCDFWRASRDGKLYTIRGYDEDGQNHDPGRVIYKTIPILLIGEGLLFTSRFAETFEEVDQIAIHCRFTGLEGRSLRKAPWDNYFSIDHSDPSKTDEVILTDQITQQQAQDNLAEFLHPFLQRLYEKFNFYELPFDFVAKEVQRLRSNQS